MLEFINKILVLIYIMAILNVVRHGYFFIQAWIESFKGTPIQINMLPQERFMLGLSISYVVTGIILGVTF